MKTKSIAAVSILAVLLLYVTFQSVRIAITKQKDYNRAITNEVKLKDSINYYRSRRGTETAKTPVLEYKIDELKKLMPEITAALHDLKIKPARVESFAQAEVQQQKEITAHLRDTTILVNNIITPVHAFRFTDPWYDVWGLIDTTSVNLKINSTDTITQVVSRGERTNPWLWIFSRRKLQQTIQSSNPANKIVYSRYIKIKE